MKTTKNKKTLLRKMKSLRESMLDVATEFDYFGGFDQKAKQHSDEMLGAAAILHSWIVGFGDVGEMPSKPEPEPIALLKVIRPEGTGTTGKATMSCTFSPSSHDLPAGVYYLQISPKKWSFKS